MTHTSLRTLCFMSLALGLGLAHNSVAKPVKHYTQLTYPDLADPTLPEVRQLTLANGIRLFLLADRTLPLIHFTGLIRTGDIYEPADKLGLAGITGQVMRTGGTTDLPGDQMDEQLESMAASVETDIGTDIGQISASALTENASDVLAILAQVLMAPAFPEDKIALAKMQQRSSISRRNDMSEDIASREFYKLIYGPNSVYARQIEYATLDAITRADLVAFHQQYFVPNNLMLAVWGDFDTEEMIRNLTTVFANWEKKNLLLPDRPPVTYDYPVTVNLVSKADINQSHIIMGHIGGRRNDPDYFACLVANRILGDSFTGRLFKNIRSLQGLAYSVFGHYGAHYAYPGVFNIGCQTKSESTVQAIEAMRHEVERMKTETVTEQELAVAKESFLNSFIFNFDTRGEIVQRMMIYDYYGYPADFLLRTKRQVEQVSQADVQRVAQQYFQPDKMQILVVGRPGDFDRPLSVLGVVNKIDITIPGSGQP